MNNYIKQIQTAMQAAGHYTGKIDGIAGQMTLDAVNKALANSAPKPTPKPAPTPTPETAKSSGFALSDKSIQKMDGVKDDLRVVKRAIEISDTDFAVIEGLRTKERQAYLVKKGASKTMNSKHLTGDAVDIAPVIDGKISWDFEHYYPMAKAMAKAATELGVKVRWGGAWTTITGKSGTPQDWVKAYRAGGGRFLDGLHFELV